MLFHKHSKDLSRHVLTGTTASVSIYFILLKMFRQVLVKLFILKNIYFIIFSFNHEFVSNFLFINCSEV